ncbi:MAG: Crp/Fnr family transcriptional regulator [Betaproteobacteria bacterium]|nr:Crp/Fnr family transcriptional regulator [Betaproteobacteria bacterium]MDE2623253.1 Crp/Fnr family transcriptional regulator [Betaproteobacteria bacterium]
MFRELSADEIERIALASREIHAPKGTILFQKGDPSNGFYLVVVGQLKLSFLSHTGAEKIVEIIGAGQTFGEAVMFLEKPYPVYAQALTDSQLLLVAKSAVFEEIAQNRSFALKMLAGLSIRLHGLVHDVAAYSLDTAIQRLIGFLLSQDLQENEQRQPTVRLPAGKGVIASRLNISAETFSRILHDLTESGLIEVQGRDIILKNVETLRKIGL